MDTAHIILVLLTFVLSGFCLWKFRRARKTLSNAKYLETSTIGDVEQSLYDMQNLEGETYRHYCELKGQAKTDNCITSIFSKEQSLWYNSTITEHYEKLTIDKDSDGKTRRRWSSGTKQVSNYKKSAINYLEDETSQNRMYIDPDNNFDIPVTYSHTGTNRTDEMVIRFNLNFYRTSSYRTKYYTFTERSLIPNSEVYILGDAYKDEEQNLKIGMTDKAGAIGIVTTKSEDEVIKGFSRSSIIWIISSVLSLILGVYMIISVCLS